MSVNGDGKERLKMNANELADELDDYYIAITDEYTGFGYLKEAATMLR